MNKLLKLAIANAVMMAGLDGRFDTPYTTGIEPQAPRVRDTQRDLFDTSNIKVVNNRQLKEFSIQGNKVMAFSRKDAITRLKAMKKLKRK